MESPRLIIVLAGPNGAGKTTFYQEYLSELGIPFINADLLAAERLNRAANTDEEALEAARVAEAQRQSLVQSGASFIFETVLSDTRGAKITFIQKAKAQGYFIEAFFIGLENPMLSTARVMQRVEAGGHDVPDEKLAARYPRTLKNLVQLIDVADRLILYDNSSTDQPFRRIASFESGQLIACVKHPPAWTESLRLHNRRTATTKNLQD
jgi:predicted ABC-type ATPase